MTTGMTGAGARTATTRPGLRTDRGLGLLEVMVAQGILLVLALGILPLGLVAVAITENQGHLAARTTEYSQDKMEQLLTLAYNDASTDTRVFPSAQAGGTGLAVGGSADANTPAAGYVDYLDVNGNLITSASSTAPAGWYYRRVWRISNPSGTTLIKQVTVTTIVAHAFPYGRVPQTTLVALKTSPF